MTELSLPITATPEIGRKMDEHQRAFLKQAKQKDIIERLKKETEGMKPSLDSIPKKMRDWLTSTLTKIPFNNLSVDEETYSELVSQEVKNMEWGVMKKAISIILGMTPEVFPISEETKKVYLCAHSNQEQLKFCTICDSKGFLTSHDKPSEEQLTLLNYNQIVLKCSSLSKEISAKYIEVENKIIEDIWWNKLSPAERHNMNGEINKWKKANGYN